MAFPLIQKLRAIGQWMPDASSPFPPNVPRWLRRSCETLYWRQHVWEIEKGRQIWRGRIFKSPLPRISDGVRRLLAFLFEGMVVSIIVQLWLLPLLIYYFHRVSPISVLLNLWVGAVIAVESFAALFAVLFGMLSDDLALPFAMLTNGLNWLLIEVPRMLAYFDAASIRVPIYSGPGKMIYLIYLVPIVALAATLHRWDPFALRHLKRSAVGFSVGLAAGFVILGSVMVFHPFSEPRPDGDLKIEFLDVGQGDSAFITFPNGETMLIDGGGRVNYGAEEEDLAPFEPDVPRIGEMVVSEFLWEKGYARIDRLVVSHADADHSQGLADVVRNFSVGEILIGSQPAADSELAELRAAAKRYSVPIRQIGKGDTLEIGGVKIDVLWPVAGSEPTASDNNSSLVMRLTFGETRFLFTGDIEREAEGSLVNQPGMLDSDVIKVPHHGSRTSSTQSFIDAVSARIAIIPVGRRSLYGHPHPEVVERWMGSAADVRTTGAKGMISVVSDGREMRLTAYKE